MAGKTVQGVLAGKEVSMMVMEMIPSCTVMPSSSQWLSSLQWLLALRSSTGAHVSMKVQLKYLLRGLSHLSETATFGHASLPNLFSWAVIDDTVLILMPLIGPSWSTLWLLFLLSHLWTYLRDCVWLYFLSRISLQKFPFPYTAHLAQQARLLVKMKKSRWDMEQPRNWSL